MKPMTRLLVTGGTQRKNAFELPEGTRHHSAKLMLVDMENNKLELLILYEGNQFNYPDKTPNIIFTAGYLFARELLLCTETEVFLYDYPTLKLMDKVSYPFFQNVHHVCPIADYIAVTSTGLDMVIFLESKSLKPVSFFNVLGKEPWHRFSKDFDYRKIHSTKPHDSHPNFTFAIDGEPWVTRFNQKDAVNLYRMEQRIDLGQEAIHDGHVIGDYVYFTSVNGRIIIANTKTLRVEETIDLNEIESVEQPLGWCRGLLVDGYVAYVGFSRLRRTKWKENLHWTLRFIGPKKTLPTRIVSYDLRKKVKVSEFSLPVGTIDTIYGLLKEPDLDVNS